MPFKNIVICADGTGNTTIKGRGTNVFKLYEAVDGNGHRADPSLVPQVAIYHDGVGTGVVASGCAFSRAPPDGGSAATSSSFTASWRASTTPAIGFSCSASAAARSRCGRWRG